MLGVLSWSGTAFEYFMPTLFIEPVQNTLEWEAAAFALRAAGASMPESIRKKRGLLFCI